MPTELLPLRNLFCACCGPEIVAAVSAIPGVHHARMNAAQDALEVMYDEVAVDLGEVTSRVRSIGYGCGDGEPAVNLDHAVHQAELGPIAVGHPIDRMQYEMRATSASKSVHHGHHGTGTNTGSPAKHEGHAAGPAGPAAVDHAAHAAHTAQAPSNASPTSAHAGHGMSHDMGDPVAARAMETDMRRRFFVALALTVPIVLYSPLFTETTGVDMTPPFDLNWFLLLLTTPVVLYSGWIFIAGSYYSLMARQLNMSVLIATGVLAAYGFSILVTVLDEGETFYDAAAMLVTFVLFGHWMEMRSRRGTTDALRALFDLVPPKATLVRAGEEVEVETSAIVPGDIIRLRPGERVAVDGEVTEGETAVDESLITGESIPVAKRTGDEVVGGSINGRGSVLYRATRVGAESALAQIVALVAAAQNSKAPGQRLADRAAQYLVVVAVGAGVATFLAWYLVGGETMLFALTFAISAIVIACPDALGLATPTAVAVGTGLGARHGVLIKDAATLEGVARITTVVFDKTGTLTEGRPSLVGVSPAAGFDEDEVLRLAAGAEASSEHPLALAVVEGARARGMTIPAATTFDSDAGRGLHATVEGRTILVGNRLLLDQNGVAADALQPVIERETAQGRTAVFVAIDGRTAGVVAVADTVRPSARRTVERLRDLGIEVVMMTGDNRRTADAVARDLGISRVLAEVLPGDKASNVAALQGEGKVVAMVGDGVNDAPALAQADIGIAIGAGTDVAIATAKVVLMRSDPLGVLVAHQLSKATVRKMKQNLFWASVYNVLAIPVAAGIFYPEWGLMLRPEISALLMSASSIIVATNAVLLRRTAKALAAESSP